MTLMGILGGIGLFSLRSQLDGARLTEGAARIAATLFESRAGAIHEGRIWRVEVYRNALRLHAGGRNFGGVPMPEGVRLTLNSNGDVRFYPDGHAENGTFRLANPFGEKTVVLNQRGRVRLP
ncbi:MAG TPA: hypothetical protein DCG06_16230 [Deltaproteobacteria bacterium]|nr:hypothetical protein [Deltaproteobacteria bacterium]